MWIQYKLKKTTAVVGLSPGFWEGIKDDRHDSLLVGGDLYRIEVRLEEVLSKP